MPARSARKNPEQRLIPAPPAGIFVGWEGWLVPGSAFEQLPLMVWRSGPTKACDYFNAAWLEFTGRTLEQELGEGWAEGVHPDDLARCLAVYTSAFDARRRFSMEYRLRHRSGEYRWVRAIGAPRYDAQGRFHGYVGACVDVHDTAVAHEQSSAREEHLKLLIEQTPIALAILDQNLCYVAASQRWRADYKLGDQPLIGRSHYEVFPEIPERWKAIHRRCLAGATERCEEDPFERADGSIDWVRWGVSPWRTESGEIGGIVMTTELVSERVVAANRLRESETRFRQMAEAIREVFWLADPATRAMLYVSPAYELVWGRPGQSLIDAPETWMDAVVPEDRARVREALSRRQITGEYDEEYRIQRPDGGVRWIRDRAFPIRDARGEVHRIAGVADDVTERRELEERLRRAQQLEVVGQLAGGIAHDFNNVLTIVQANAQLVQSDPSLPSALGEPLREIAGAAERASSLTRQLLYVSRRQPPLTKTLELNDLVSSVGMMLGRVLPENVAIEIHLGARPSAIAADAGMIEQVLLNLAINARDAMPKGGRLELATSRTADAVVLTVTDQGSGIPSEALPHIFEPFYTTKDHGKGTGLGLASAHRILLQHGGSIAVESEVGRGTTFRMTFPAVAPLAASCAPAPASSALKSETILLVEDDGAVRKVAARVLERAGYRVLVAGDGADALVLWHLQGAAVAAVVTDLVMPGALSGFDLAARLREERPNLPIILTSGYLPEVAGTRSLFETEVFLPKPYSPAKLLEAVSSALAPRRVTRASSLPPV